MDKNEETVRTLYTKGAEGNGKEELESILAMFYLGAERDQLGMARLKNIETGEDELILCGVELDPEGEPVYYPIARCFDEIESLKYIPKEVEAE